MVLVITLLNWFFGLFLFASGLQLLIDGGSFPGAALILTAFLLLPPVRRIAYSITKKRLSVVERFGFFVCMLITLITIDIALDPDLRTEFSENRMEIIESVNEAFAREDYKSAVNQSSKYIELGDLKLIDINSRANRELEKQIVVEKTQQLLNEVENSSDYADLLNLYLRLAELHPENKIYSGRVIEFTALLETEKQELLNRKSHESTLVIAAEVREEYWNTSDMLNRRTCPSTDCGVVGQLYFRDNAIVYEKHEGWARISKYYSAACKGGHSAYVDEGNSDCNIDNGMRDGEIAEWVSIKNLSKNRPEDPSKFAEGNEVLISGSDDYKRYKTVFTESAVRLVENRTCKENDFLEMGGWMKSANQKNKPIYFTYCGDNRIYLDASSGKTF